MMWVYIGGGLLFLVAALALWYRFGNAKWVAGLATAFITMAVNAFLPVIAKRMPPDEEDAWNKFQRTNPDKYEIAKWRKAYRKRQKALK